MTSTTQQDSWKQLAGNAAADLIENGMLVGLGTGSTANYFVQALAQRIQAGLHILAAVPSSVATGDLATSLGIPLSDLDTYPELDIYVDGADEIDPQLRLLKGAGGALVREKIVTSAARHFIVIADVTKTVTQLGHNFPVPVETTPFGVTPVSKRLIALGADVKIRQKNGQYFITDNHNLILDCHFPAGITDPVELNERMHHIVGVVETGLFVNMAEQALIGGPQGLQHLRKKL